MMTSSSIHKYLLPSTFDSLAKVEKIIEDIRSDFSIPEEIYGNILVALSEAVNNAIKHGNQFDSEKTVGFEFNDSQNKYNFTIQDEGTGFDFENIPDPTHPDNIEKLDGRGIFIMKSLADEVEFDPKGKSVTISFNKL